MTCRIPTDQPRAAHRAIPGTSHHGSHRAPRRAPRRAIVALAAFAVAGCLPLAACSSNQAEAPSAEYCRLLTTDPQVAAAMSLDGDQVTSEQIAALRTVIAAAPKDVRDDWQTFTDYLEAMSKDDETALNDNLDKAMAAADAVEKSVQACQPASGSPTATPTPSPTS